MNCSRRSFLGGLAVSSLCSYAFGNSNGKLFTGAKGEYDANFAVLLSDVHVGGIETSPYQYAGFVKAVGEILKMDPLPANVIIFGDFAYGNGYREDYAKAAPLIKQLEDAGIKVTIGMGNHDRRKNFLEYNPSFEKSTLVPDYIVSKVNIGSADLIMLDSLVENPNEKEGNQVSGTLSGVQQEWLAEYAAKLDRPTLFGSHHPTKELTVKGKTFTQFMHSVPNVIGHIYGHNHRWLKNWARKNWTEYKIIRTLCLPSTGHWGDIGYTLLRTTNNSAVASLVQHDFYTPRPYPAGKAKPNLWKKMVEENRNQTCTFCW